ncbi:helix-turn-helix transcriptional regulator [Caulobacter sp. BP25]|nr:helix-turn-helix transcriptional regulator [Caulobacter sp. BP25]
MWERLAERRRTLKVLAMDKGDPSVTDQVEGLDRLTERERECLRLVDRHMSSKEIARELGLSKHTVDWHLDKARRRLGAADRYDAARRVFDRGRPTDAAAPPVTPPVTPPPIASGSDPTRLGEHPSFRSPDLAEEGAFCDRTDPLPEGSDWPGDLYAPGYHELPEHLAGPQFGRDPAAHHLERTRAPADEPVGDAGWRGHGPRSGGGDTQAGFLQAERTGDAGDSLHRQRGDGRDVPIGLLVSGLRGGRPNNLSIPLRLAFIAAVMIVTAFAFGSILAGLHALESLLP